MTSAVTPIFDPNGVIRQIPNDQVKDAISAGGKLAIQMVKQGDVRYIPHDQVAAARTAGAEIYDKQGAGAATQPKEGFWHSLGSVFGLTPEQLKAGAENQRDHPFKSALENTPGINLLMSAPGAVKNLASKSMDEDIAAAEAAKRGDIKGFIAHQIGSAGYTGAAVLSPVLGESPAKAGEQFGEGNVAGGAGTATGVIAPIVAPGIVKDVAGSKVGGAARIIAKPVVEAGIEAAKDIPVVRGAIKGLSRFKDVPQQLKEYWAQREAGTSEGTAAGPVPGEPAPAPYRLSGNQITDATTVTPRKVLGPDRQLAAAPEETPAAAPVKPPVTSQVLKDAGVTQAMKEAGIAAPSASSRAVRPGTTPQLTPRTDINFPPGVSGEDAALMQLTRQNINELRFIAQKRGLPVSPKDTHSELIGKIHDSLKPEEAAGFQAAVQSAKVVPSKFPENNLIADSLNDEAAQLQTTKGDPYRIATLRNAAATVRQYPEAMSKVDFTATKIRGIDKGIRQRISDTLEQQKAVPGDESQAAGAAAGQPLSVFEAMRQSLIARGIKPPY